MLIEAIETLFPDHHFGWTRSGSSAKGFCPLHKNAHTPAFAVYTDSKGREKWHCFAENIGGNLLDLVRLSGIPGTESIKGANNWMIKNGYLQETQQQKEDRERNEALYKFYQWTNDMLCNAPEASGVRAYLAGRKIDLDTLPEAAVGYYPSLQRVRAWIAEENLSELLESEVCVAEAKNLQVSGSIIFFYKSSYSEISRLKVRNVANENGKEKKTFFLGSRQPGNSKKDTMGFFSWYMNCALPEKAILVEGEFDVAALSSLVYREHPTLREPVYCFSGGGNIETGINTLTQMGITNLYIFPDNDAAGIKYAQDIAEAFPDTYNLFPEGYEPDADPADWAANHNYEDLEKAFENRRPAFMWIGQKLAIRYTQDATIEDQASIRAEIIDYGRKLSPTNRESFIKAFGSLAGVTLESIMEEIEEASADVFRKSTKADMNYGIWMNMNNKPNKNAEWKHISNVIMEHIEDTIMDDAGGEEYLQRCVTVRLSTAYQSKIVTIDLPTFIDDKKLRQAITTYMGSAAVIIEPHQESNLRNSMAALSVLEHKQEQEAKNSIVYLHTGWRDGKYYMPNCYVDENGYHDLDEIQVQLPSNPSYFEKYGLAEPPADMDAAKAFIRNEVLQVFPYEITLPYLAHVFWTVISNFLPMAKPYCLWVVGQTGSFKTSYTAVMASFFGDFRYGGSEFETWRSTANALEMNGYYLKDCIYVIDDYKPIDCKRQDVTRMIQNYADRHGRSRMAFSRDANLKRNYWLRGNLIVTAEDVPPEGETSVTARTLELRVPSNGNTEHLLNAQIGANTLPGVMTKFIEFICNKHLNPAECERLLSVRRNHFEAIHARIKENLAVNSLAWDLVAEFLGFEDLTPQYYKGVESILSNMNASTKSQLAGEVFIESIETLLATGNYYLQGMGGYYDTPHHENSTRLGWIDEKACYLVGGETLAEVNKLRIQLTGNPMNYSLRSIYDQLQARQYIIPDSKGKATKTKRIDGFQYRVVEFKRGVIEHENEEAGDKIEPQSSVVRDARLDADDE